MVMALRGGGRVLSNNPLLESRLWLCRMDEDEALRHLAEDVWKERGLPLSAGYISALIPLLSHDHPHVRTCAAKSMGAGMQYHPNSAQETVQKLQQVFMSAMPEESVSTTPGSSAALRMPPRTQSAVTEDIDTKWPTRVSIATAFNYIGASQVLASELAAFIVPDLLLFVLNYGVIDSASEVRDSMLLAGRALVDNYGQALSLELLSLLQSTLSRELTEGEDASKFDYRHEAAVVLLGAVGKHLAKEDPNIASITRSLVQALDTPSESVQRSVADCLCPLVTLLKASDMVKELLESLLVKVVNGETYGQRRGAAFGLSAFVKGVGLPCLKQFDIVNRLKEACTHGSVNNKQGALFAFECLSDRLGLLFEPYIITIIPILLKSFSHGSDHVREAANLAAKVIMGRLSPHGIKQVLNPILTSLAEESAWKSRQEAIRLLGSMANCAPKQLASCLSQIVPKLVEAGSDPHPKVKESAKQAMAEISSVIRNPEVSKLSPVLLTALSDPASKTKEALEALLECEFMHSIDAPSLSILVPILSRALRDRGADLKRKSATILGNMCSMIADPKIIVPYLQQIVPGLKDALLDPIPDVRANCAKALGSLVTGVGEAELGELLPWLLSTLQSESSPVERSGAAQGLAEVCQALGQSRRNEILVSALELHSHPRSAAREGMHWLLSFLPTAVGEAFSECIALCLPIILLGESNVVTSWMAEFLIVCR